MATLLTNAWVATMDAAGSEHPDGWVLVSDGLVEAVGGGAPPGADEHVDLGGALVTPGLINTHHHLYQTLTRTRAQEADLFTWLKTLYPIWARIDAEAEYAAARTGLAALALGGCTTVFDHHYVFPRGETGLIEAEVQAARELGVRLVASRGSMDLGESDGGLPPDSLVEDADDVLADTERLVRELHEPGPGARVQIAVAPCSPFSVTGGLMEESAALARRLGLSLHTHLAETVEEEAYCRELYGCSPVEYLERLGWLAGDVWCAHCVHLSAGDIARFAETGTGVAHCPTSNLRLGAGVAPVRELLDASVRVGLGVDGSASNERSDLSLEVKQALLVARGRGGGGAMTAREALGARHPRRRGGAAARGHRRRSSPGAAPTWRSGRPTAWSSPEPTTRSPRSSSPARSGSTGCTSGARRSSATGGCSTQTRKPSCANTSARREDSRRERLCLHPRARHERRQAGPGRRGRAAPGRRSARPRSHRRQRPHRRAGRRARAGRLHAELQAAVALLPPGRARAGARGRPLPRPPPRLALRMRELPRQLTTGELARLFSGQTPLVERLAGEPDPLGPAAEAVLLAAPLDEQVEALAAHPRIGEPSKEQRGAEPEVLAELADLNRAYENRFGFRFVVFVAGRTRADLLPVLHERLERTREEELETGLRELVAIARDRWQKG